VMLAKVGDALHARRRARAGRQNRVGPQRRRRRNRAGKGRS
jgi:hypothetical protein